MKGVILVFTAKYVQIGAKIRYYRTIRMLEQIALADRLGITSQYLSKIERGAAKPSTDLLFLFDCSRAKCRYNQTYEGRKRFVSEESV